MAQENQSEYARYNEEHGVAPVTAYLDKELVEMIKAAAKKAGVKQVAFMTQVFTTAVNAAGLTNADGSPRTYTIKTKESELVRVKRELEEAAARIAELEAKITPTPPAVQANASTGKVEEKVKVKA